MTGDNARSAGFVVWVRGLRGPEIQKWSRQMMGAVSARARIVVSHGVSASLYSLPLDELARLYPPPTEPSDD